MEKCRRVFSPIFHLCFIFPPSLSLSSASFDLSLAALLPLENVTWSCFLFLNSEIFHPRCSCYSHSECCKICALAQWQKTHKRTCESKTLCPNGRIMARSAIGIWNDKRRCIIFGKRHCLPYIPLYISAKLPQDQERLVD